MTRPIACSLDDGAATARVDEWREVLAGVVVSARRPSRDLLLFELDCAGPQNGTASTYLESLGKLLQLSLLEKRCCPFLDLNFEVTPSGVTLTIEAPAETVPILDGFASLVSERRGGQDE